MQIKIGGMSCNNCKKSVEEALSKVKGVKNVKVDLEGGFAEVEGDFDIDVAKEAVEAIGFDVL